MQVALHVGAHFTDNDKIVKCLGQNRKELGGMGIMVPKPNTYRRPLRNMLHDVRKSPIEPSMRQDLLAQMVGAEQPDRIVLSSQHFFGVSNIALTRGKFYATAQSRLANVSQIFYQDEVEVFLALCNPATFLPALFNDTQSHSFDGFMAGCNPQSLSWVELINRIRTDLPKLQLTVWCNEDTPLIWDQVVREMAGIEANHPIKGSHDLLKEIMSKEGMSRFEAYLDARPQMTDVQKRRVIAAFLDKFALDDEIEEELDLPGWNEELIEVISEQYEEDAYQIGRIPGVNFISP